MQELMTEVQHVVPYEDVWAVRAERSEMPSKVFETKLAAVAYAYDIADRNDGRIVVHNRDGTFRSVHVTEEISKFMSLLLA